MSISTTSTVSRKRRHLEAGLIRLSTPVSSDVDASSHAGPSEGPLGLVNRTLTTARKRKYHCQYDQCGKAYTKPSRLAEHERSHTGERPFVCSTCNKAYLRETHLQAHARSHLPESDRPFVCDATGCGKRFWTSQHLRTHEEWHRDEKPFKCDRSGCPEAFMKHHQLRSHVCTAHSPPGTKPYICTHDGCTKSFATNQKLRTHTKVHEDNRYACVHPSCSTSAFYPTWTALQAHIRMAHPPTCPYSQCHGKTFTQHKGLRAHMKLHAAEDEFNLKTDVEEGRRAKRRRGGEWGREWVCDVDGCKRDFKSKTALSVHVNVTHLGKRDHVCPEESCGMRFGYKHLLQRHMAKKHERTGFSYESSDEGDRESSGSDFEEEETAPAGTIDFLTGKAYADGAKDAASRKLRCPFPHAPFLSAGACTSDRCEYVFSRAYDVRRHLRGIHKIDATKEDVEVWVAMERGIQEFGSTGA